MDQLSQAIQQMIAVSPAELEAFLKQCHTAVFARKALLMEPGKVPDRIFFINKGILRVIILDQGGSEHTVHFGIENQFIGDYSSFLQNQPAIYSLQALEETEVVVLTRAAIDWGYNHLQEGNKLGRLVAEGYFVYHDNRIKNMYARTPRERYDLVNQVFPGIENRVPQRMIASYLGITPVHLSRLKNADRQKV